MSDRRPTTGSKALSRVYTIGRFAARYVPGMGGTGHALSVKNTKEMIRELLAGERLTVPKQELVIEIILTELLDPPDEIRSAMVGAVESKHDASHIEGFRMMLRTYAELQYGLKIEHARYDK